VITVAWPGISVSISGPRLAETTTFSWTGAGVGCGAGSVWAEAEAATSNAMVIDGIAAFGKRMNSSFVSNRSQVERKGVY
jgi:hypothetical protein